MTESSTNTKSLPSSDLCLELVPKKKKKALVIKGKYINKKASFKKIINEKKRKLINRACLQTIQIEKPFNFYFGKFCLDFIWFPNFLSENFNTFSENVNKVYGIHNYVNYMEIDEIQKNVLIKLVDKNQNLMTPHGIMHILDKSSDFEAKRLKEIILKASSSKMNKSNMLKSHQEKSGPSMEELTLKHKNSFYFALQFVPDDFKIFVTHSIITSQNLLQIIFPNPTQDIHILENGLWCFTFPKTTYYDEISTFIEDIILYDKKKGEFSFYCLTFDKYYFNARFHYTKCHSENQSSEGFWIFFQIEISDFIQNEIQLKRKAISFNAIQEDHEFKEPVFLNDSSIQYSK